MKPSKLALALCVILFSSFTLLGQSTTSSVDQSKAKQLDAEGSRLLKEYRYQKAISKYSEALERDEKAIYAVHKAEVYLILGKIDKAEESYQAAISIDSTMGLGYLGVANCIKEIDINNDSLNWYMDKALHLCNSDKERTEALTTLAELKMTNGDYLLAEKYVVAANKLDPENIQTQAVMASVLFELNEKEEAIVFLENIVEKDNDNIRYMISLGYLYNNVERYRDAEKILDRALFYEPDNPYVLANKAYTLLRTNRMNEADKVADKSIKNDQTNAYGHYVKGLLDLENKNVSKACKCFNKAMDRSSLQQDRSFKEIKEAVENNCDSPTKI